MSSPYREGSVPRAETKAQTQSGPLAVVDATGADGAPAQDGANGFTGRDGGHAGPAYPGEPGGTIDVTLRPAGPEAVAIVGTVERRREAEAVTLETPIGDAGSIRFVAFGGSGGRGGIGGHGGTGATGAPGSDATRFSRGSDGGNGGDGGDGGNGTPGAPGGPGGRVVVRANRKDTHLFMLADLAVGGGRGGRGGQNGVGGSGGAGGRGGSSYHWTESETYTDSQGNTQTRSTSHSNSGGSDGRSGMRGADGRGVIHPGADGPPGTLSFVVTDGTKSVHYPWRYELRLTGVVHVDENGDGVYEPEEKVSVTQITVTNVGGMPTPETHEIRVALVDNGWVAPEGERSLVVPAGLAAGASHTFTETLTFRLRLFRPQEAGEALRVTERVGFVCWLPDVRRQFTAFERDIGDMPVLLVQFPAKLSPLEAPFALAPGERARVRFEVENVSARALGEAEGRALETTAGASGDAEAKVDVTEAQPIRALPSETRVGQSIIVELPENAPDYTTTTVTVELALAAPAASGEAPAEPAPPRPIQRREFSIRTVTPYASRKVDVVFVLGSSTTRDEIQTWTALATSLGLSSSVYDLTMELAIDETKLAVDAAGGAVVVLNEASAGTDGNVLPEKKLLPDALMAIAASDTRVAIVGRAGKLDGLLFPEGETKDDSLALVGPKVSLAPTKWLFAFSTPKPEHLLDRARALQSWLDRSRPHERHAVRHVFTPETETSALLAKRHRLGRLTVVRGLPAGALVSIELASHVLHDVNALATDVGLAALAVALPSALLVKRYFAIDATVTAVVRRVIVARIAGELSRSLRAGHAGREALPTLLALVEHATKEPDDRLAVLLGDLQRIAGSLVRFWEWVPPFPWLRTGPRLRRLVRELVDEARQRAGLDEAAVTKARNASALAKLPFAELAAELDAALPFPVRDEHEEWSERGVPTRTFAESEVTERAERWQSRRRKLAKSAEAAATARRKLLET